MPKGNPNKPPKRQQPIFDWEKEQVTKGYEYAFDYTPEQIAEMRKGKIPLEFFDPSKFSKKDGKFIPLTDEAKTVSPFIRYGVEVNRGVPSTVTRTETNRAPLQIGPNITIDPNTGKYYDSITKAEVAPMKKGGVVGRVSGYFDGGEIPYDLSVAKLANKKDSADFAKGYNYGLKNTNISTAGLDPNLYFNDPKFNGMWMGQAESLSIAEEKSRRQKDINLKTKPQLTNEQVLDIASKSNSGQPSLDGEFANLYNSLNKYDQERVYKAISRNVDSYRKSQSKKRRRRCW